MKETCGMIIVCEGRFLVAHPTRSSWSSWSIPKGIREANETHEQAALRETFEETNLDLLRHPGARTFVGQALYPARNKTLFAFLQVLPEMPTETLVCNSFVSAGFPECDAFRWVTYDEGLLLLNKPAQILLNKVREVITGSAPPKA